MAEISLAEKGKVICNHQVGGLSPFTGSVIYDDFSIL